MPRDPIAALVQFVLGSLLGAAGFVMLGWVAVTYFDPEMGSAAITWAAQWSAENSPVPLTIPVVELAHGAAEEGSLIALGVAGLFLFLIGNGLLNAAGANMRPATPVATDALPAPAPSEAPAAAAGSTVFARTMLSDLPSAAPRAAARSPVGLDPHAGSSVSLPTRLEADLEGFARLFGTDGRFTAQQRAALARLTPEQQAALAKLSKWAPSRRNAIIALVALFVAFQVLPSIFSLLLNR